jgi:predicted transposase YbfD/YdcC
VERTRIELTKPARKPKTDAHATQTEPVVEQKTAAPAQPATEKSVEIGCYATSLSEDEQSEAGLEEIIRGHWSAIENGTHYRRDVTLGEDACRTTGNGAEVLASLRNLALGIYELQRARGRTKVDTLASWSQQQTFSKAWAGLHE